MRINKNRRFYLYVTVFLIVISLAVAGCGRKEPRGRVVVKVNDYTLTADEFNELFLQANILSPDTPEARAVFVENLINRKLILQDAQRRGLDRKKDFLKAIENFWEQSLLTIAVDRKTKEIAGTVKVTNQEVREEYEAWIQKNPGEQRPLNDMRNTIMTQLLKRKESAVLNTWVDAMRKDAQIAVDRKAIGIE